MLAMKTRFDYRLKHNRSVF